MESFMLLGFGIDAWITIATVLGVFIVLMTTKLRSDLVFLAAIGLLFLTGVLDADEAFSGFSSSTVVVVGVLAVVVAGLTYTGVLHWITKHVLGRPKDYKRALLRVMTPVAVLSPLLNTVTVVSVFVGVVKMWAKKLKRAPKIFQKLNLEWFYRLLCQPSRFKRIFPAIPLFLLKPHFRLFQRG